jgi:hypothetical protein
MRNATPSGGTIVQISMGKHRDWKLSRFALTY